MRRLFDRAELGARRGVNSGMKSDACNPAAPSSGRFYAECGAIAGKMGAELRAVARRLRGVSRAEFGAHGALKRSVSADLRKALIDN